MAYVVVRYRQLIPSGFGPGEQTLTFETYLSALAYAEQMQVDQPGYWWCVERQNGYHVERE